MTTEPCWNEYRRTTTTPMVYVEKPEDLMPCAFIGRVAHRVELAHEGGHDIAYLHTNSGVAKSGFPFYLARDPMGHPYPISPEAFAKTFAPATAPDPAVEAMRARKDAAYEERNRVVAALAGAVVQLGGRAWRARTDIPGWDAEWHGCVYIEFPGAAGQASWHYHDSQAHLFDGIPWGTIPYDGHTTPQKYERVALFAALALGDPKGGQPTTSPAGLVQRLRDIRTGFLALRQPGERMPLAMYIGLLDQQVIEAKEHHLAAQAAEASGDKELRERLITKCVDEFADCFSVAWQAIGDNANREGMADPEPVIVRRIETRILPRLKELHDRDLAVGRNGYKTAEPPKHPYPALAELMGGPKA